MFRMHPARAPDSLRRAAVALKKDNCHDYVSEAFRYYAQCGCPNGERLRAMRLNTAEWQRADFLDLEAVCRVVDRIKTEPDGITTLRCLELIYFKQPKAAPTRGNVSERVAAAADELCLSESAVYRIMKRLRYMLAVERGLRIDGSQSCNNLLLALN